MAKFRYRALTARGEIVTGELVAPHEAEVIKRIEYLGLIPIETFGSAETDGGLASIFTREWSFAELFKRRANADDVTVFSRDLAILLRSGVRIDQALDLLSEPEMSGHFAPIAAALRASVNAGESFADALSRHDIYFPPVYIALARIGEASGGLAGVIESLAEERARVTAMRRKALDALRYPAFIFCAATLVLVFFLFFVLPQFAVVLRDLGSRMDPVVGFMLSLSDFARANTFAIGIGAGLLALSVTLALRSRVARQRFTRWFLRLPGPRSIAIDYRTAVFCRGLGVLLGNGVRLTTALKLVAGALAGDGAEGVWLRASERVRQGARLGEALLEINELSPVAVRMLRIGEESGHLAPISLRAADLFEERVERRLGRLVGIIGPAAILFIAFVVGGLVVSLMTSLISIGQLAN